MDYELNIARAVAPEDLRPGQYVAPLHVVSERVREAWECLDASSDKLVRMARLPEGEPIPVLIVEVCLPFVFIQTAEGKHSVLDVRRWRLAHVAEQFGQRVFAQLAAEKRDEEKAAETKSE